MLGSRCARPRASSLPRVPAPNGHASKGKFKPAMASGSIVKKKSKSLSLRPQVNSTEYGKV